MAGTVITDVVQSSISGTPPQFNDGNGTQTGTLCRAWVNFNGTGTVAIRASFNVSSITDNGTGDYTVNFTTAMPDTNYSLAGACSFAPTSTSSAPVVDIHTLATGSARIVTTRYTDNVIDLSTVAVSIFR